MKIVIRISLTIHVLVSAKSNKLKCFMECVARNLKCLTEIKEDIKKIKEYNREIAKVKNILAINMKNIKIKLNKLLPALEKQIQLLEVIV